MNKWLNMARLDRVESIYLLILRVAGLVIATLCLIAALFFLADGLWRLGVSTRIAPEPTVVNSSDIARAMQTAPATTGSADPAIPEAVRATHTAFARNFWPKYYAVYKSAFDRYKKADDELIGSQDLMNNLGYSLNNYYAVSYDPDTSPNETGVVRLVEDADYQALALLRVTEAMGARTTVALLTQFKAATKSEQRCVTTPQTQVIPQTCGYYYVYDCSITRQINVERCEAVYPDGIVSPIQAFERADRTFSTLFLQDEANKRETAETKIAKREETRAKIGPNLRLALTILMGFLAVMFFFLIVAIERHLRKVASSTTDGTEKVT
jgi:hypothetical protein